MTSQRDDEDAANEHNAAIRNLEKERDMWREISRRRGKSVLEEMMCKSAPNSERERERPWHTAGTFHTSEGDRQWIWSANGEVVCKDIRPDDAKTIIAQTTRIAELEATVEKVRDAISGYIAGDLVYELDAMDKWHDELDAALAPPQPTKEKAK